MKINEIIVEAKAVKQRLDAKCWKGKHKEGTKIKGGVRVNNCVPNESVEESWGYSPPRDYEREAEYEKKQKEKMAAYRAANPELFKPKPTKTLARLQRISGFNKVSPEEQARVAAAVDGYLARGMTFDQALVLAQKGPMEEAANAAQQAAIAIAKKKKAGINEELDQEFDMIETMVEHIAARNNVDSEVVWEDLESLTDDELYVFAVTQEPVNEDWQKVNKKDKTDGMSKKAVASYRREHPGSKLKTAVTTKPSKLKKGSKASKRRKSYCSRSKGQMNMHNISCAKTPDKAICKARRRWNC